MSAYICLNCGSVASKNEELECYKDFSAGTTHHLKYYRNIPSRFILQKKYFLVKVEGEVYEGNLEEPFGSINLQELMRDLIPYTQGYKYLWPTDEPSIFVEVDERVRDGEEFGGEIAYNYQIIFLTKVHPDNINMNRFLHGILQDNNGNEFDGIDGNYTVEIKQIGLLKTGQGAWPFINWATNPLDVEEQVVKPKKKKKVPTRDVWDDWGNYDVIFKAGDS